MTPGDFQNTIREKIFDSDLLIFAENPAKIFQEVRKPSFALASWKTQLIINIENPLEKKEFSEKVAEITVKKAQDPKFLENFNLDFSKPIEPTKIEIFTVQSASSKLIQKCFTEKSEIDSKISDFLASVSPDDPKWTKKVKKGLRRILRPLEKSVRRKKKREIFGKSFTGKINMKKILRSLKRKLEKGKFETFVQNFGQQEICKTDSNIENIALTVADSLNLPEIKEIISTIQLITEENQSSWSRDRSSESTKLLLNSLQNIFENLSSSEFDIISNIILSQDEKLTFQLFLLNSFIKINFQNTN